MVIWRKKFKLSVEGSTIFYLSLGNGLYIMGHMSLVVICLQFFCIILDAHAVQYGINFDNSVEIHLTYRK
jgi:hypothetical protein